MQKDFLPPDENDVLEFGGTRKTKLVKIAGQKYLLVEMMNSDLTAWTKYQATRVRERNGKPDIERANFDDFYAKLISMCLYDEKGDARIPMETIRDTFTASVISGLFDACQTLNGLNQEGRDEAKKT